MRLPAKTETEKEHKLVEQTAGSVRRARRLAKKLERSPPVRGDKKLRRTTKKSVEKLKAAVRETEKLADVWEDRIERDE